MIHRRDAMIRLGALGAGGLLSAPRPARATAGGAADSFIYVFLWGGPPQHDSFDLKPDAPAEIRGPFHPIATNVPGVRISDGLPLLARQMDKVAVVRSLTHPSNNHEPSVYHMLTGRPTAQTRLVPRNQRVRTDFPCVGSVLSQFAPPSDAPANVTVPRPIGHGGVTYAGTYAGFLGPRHDPLERAPAKDGGEPSAFAMDPAPDVPDDRAAARSELLQRLERTDAALQRAGAAHGLDAFREQALKVASSAAVRLAFNLDGEPPRVRDRYGRSEYGESFLLARRLVEAGVRAVTITWTYIFPNGRVSNVWDNHAGYGIHGAKTGMDLLRSPVCLPPLDQGLSALLEDLHDRGLLGRTLISVAGEFGRTPKINKDAGRDHWGACQSALFAGGGVRGGQVYGASDKIGAFPTDKPVSPEDFLATVYHGMGIDPDAELHDREARPHRLYAGRPLTELFG